jgi:hypothetical protein
VLAPSSPLRAAAIALRRDVATSRAHHRARRPRNARSPARYLWAMLP